MMWHDGDCCPDQVSHPAGDLCGGGGGCSDERCRRCNQNSRQSIPAAIFGIDLFRMISDLFHQWMWAKTRCYSKTTHICCHYAGYTGHQRLANGAQNPPHWMGNCGIVRKRGIGDRYSSLQPWWWMGFKRKEIRFMQEQIIVSAAGE